MANARLLPDHLFKSLRLTKPENYNIYLVGSRLWGTNNQQSDWDLLMIGDVPANLSSGVHKCQYDIKLLSRQTFVERIKEGSIIEVVCALLRREDMLQHAFDVERTSIRLDAIRNWVSSREEKDFEKAEKFWQKGNRQAGWKILRHILHARSLVNYLAIVLQEQEVTLTIDDIQGVVRPATLLCDKAWMQLEWVDARAATIDAFNAL